MAFLSALFRHLGTAKLPPGKILYMFFVAEQIAMILYRAHSTGTMKRFSAFNNHQVRFAGIISFLFLVLPTF